MSDFQKMMDAIAEQDMKRRSQYHLTLGALADICIHSYKLGRVLAYANGNLNPKLEVNSYRGYYCDLAIATTTDPDEICRTKDFGELLKRTIDTPLTGYKGGNFLMGKDTPLWLSDYGEYTGLAIMDASEDYEGDLMLKVKKIEV